MNHANVFWNAFVWADVTSHCPKKVEDIITLITFVKMDNLNFSLDDEIIDIEWCTLHGHIPPKGRKYRIIIDREKYVVDKECMTGREILIKGGKNPERFQLRQKLKGGQAITIPNDKMVCFTDSGIEKFKTLPLDQTEGEVPRRDFTLLEEDEAYLESLGLLWEAVKLEGALWILIYNYALPSGYTATNAELGIRISPGYPTTQLDMIYFYPAISRIDGLPIGGLSLIQIDGKNFQQWSRHRTGENPWRSDIDNLGTHVPLADAWLELEFEKRPNAHAIPV
jgi:hypothetical protein